MKIKKHFLIIIKFNLQGKINVFRLALGSEKLIKYL